MGSDFATTCWPQAILDTEPTRRFGHSPEVEVYWHNRWVKAKRSLEEASARFQAIQEGNGVLGPDGGYAYRHALGQETAALVEYSRVLRLYTDLILYGKVPSEDGVAPA